jgi:O-methyltransferase involved in polyketide biosynthesis
MKKIKPTFKENVSETLLIPLYMRAKEAEEKNLTENQIKRIFKNIDNNFPNAEIHIERISKDFSQRTETQQSVSATNATFAWGCDNPLEIEDWGLKLIFQSEFYYFSQHFSQMYKRLGIKAFILKYLSKYRRSIGIWSYRKAG